ncbi:hypothetical protein JQK87_33760 [Streptomyces sp. G44]|uniref:hypothetical protein n=1 Tax=Streptomyces sp. G44 TaxID=2807632 RepID=UPI0019613091|nr:hypothetical protein [Streptomyces sp. G44]MBM7173267.1 hypothetical protein [Streptomyces sp. G44]
MTEIIEVRHEAGYVTCVKEFRVCEAYGAAKYRSHIGELGGFAGARCASDADRCWSSGPAMRDNDLEAMCSMPVTPGLSAAMSWFQEGERAWRP